MTNTRPWYGFLLSLLTAFMWGVLPVAFVPLLNSLDPITITWVRFTIAMLVVMAVLWRSNQLPSLTTLSTSTGWQLLIAVIALLGNFIWYFKGLQLLNPESTQVLIQLAPFILMFGSVYFYGERFGVLGWCGALLLVSGLLLFFNNRLAGLLRDFSTDTLGIFYMLLASLTWGIYGLLQKKLLRQLPAAQVTLLIYVAGVLVLGLFSSPLALLQLNTIEVVLLLFCGFNMVLGYGAFTEALRVWGAARVSAVIALAPVFTIVFMQVAVVWWPVYFSSSQLNVWSYLGAALVVAGSMLAAFGKS